jgi:hypothetical protein
MLASSVGAAAPATNPRTSTGGATAGDRKSYVFTSGAFYTLKIQISFNLANFIQSKYVDYF